MLEVQGWIYEFIEIAFFCFPGLHHESSPWLPSVDERLEEEALADRIGSRIDRLPVLRAGTFRLRKLAVVSRIDQMCVRW